jgi:mannose-6-phosphate isomerase-like protein (cupin superfamily)
MRNLALALACTILAASLSFGQQAKISSNNPLAPSFVFPADAELIRKIRSATEAEPGRPGLYFAELSTSPEYQVIGLRRTVTGKSELHAGITDVWYVLKGTATLVSGGSMIDSVEVQPGEFRGTGVKGGADRIIRAGEFAVIPAGVAHWSRDIKGKEFIYIVVKIHSGKP